MILGNASVIDGIQHGIVLCCVFCGAQQIAAGLNGHDGSFSGKLVDGAGVLAQKLLERGIPVKDEEEI